MERKRKKLKVNHRNSVEPSFPFSELLKDLQIHVLSFLRFEDILNARRSCRNLRNLIDSHFARLFVHFHFFSRTISQRIEEARKIFGQVSNLYGVDYSSLYIDEVFIEILPRSLKVLNLSHCDLRTSDKYAMDVDRPVVAQSLELIFKKLPPSLTELNLNYCIKSLGIAIENVDEPYLCNSFSLLPRDLTKLEVLGCFFNEHSLEKFPPKMKYLDCSDSIYLSGEQIKQIPSSLTWLRLEFCDIESLSHLTNLTELHCRAESGFRCLSSLAKLQLLYLTECSIEDGDLAMLPKALLKLSLKDCDDLEGTGFSNVGTKLTSLEIHNCEQIAIANLPVQLKNLRVVVADEMFFDFTSIRNLTNLTRLDLIKYDVLLKELQYLPKSLQVFAANVVSDISLIDISVEDEFHHFLPNCELVEPEYISFSDSESSESGDSMESYLSNSSVSGSDSDEQMFF